ncbi:MAG: 6-pyruvoyl-tetrahydropterin synthase-related protein, partial [Thermoanaerobaculia bacterium]
MTLLRRLPLLLPLLALPLLLATTSGETAIAPRGIVLVAAAVLFAVLAGTGGERPRPWLDLPLAAVMGLAAGHLLFAPGIPRGHDTLHHLWGVWAVAREAAGGDPAALWLHGLGLGMPVLQFYGPGALYATLPLSLAGMAPVEVVKAGFLAFGALAAMTMVAAVTRWTGDRRAGLVAAAAYAFAPYRLLDTQYRAAFGECAALALLPLVFLFGVEAVRDGGRRRMAIAAVPAALLIVTHPISALMSTIGLGVWTLSGFRRLPGTAIRNLGVWLLGAALAGFFVVPFAAGLRSLEVGRIAQGSQREYLYLHGLDLRDLLWRRPWAGLHVSSPAGDPAEGTVQEMPFYFGLGLLSLLPLAAGLDRREAKGLPWMVLLALALSMGKLAAWISLAVPGLAAIQFPWRFLGLATFGAAAGAGFAAARLLRFRRWAILVPGAIAGLLILDAAPFTGAADWLPSYERFGWLHLPAPECGRPWGCWEVEPVDSPYPFRAAGLFLPPPEPPPGPAANTGLFCCAYPEYGTPAVRQ